MYLYRVPDFRSARFKSESEVTRCVVCIFGQEFPDPYRDPDSHQNLIAWSLGYPIQNFLIKNLVNNTAGRKPSRHTRHHSLLPLVELTSVTTSALLHSHKFHIMFIFTEHIPLDVRMKERIRSFAGLGTQNFLFSGQKKIEISGHRSHKKRDFLSFRAHITL